MWGITGSGTNVIKSVARWNGATWNSIGTGTLKVGPKCMREFNGDLIVGGAFSAQGTIPNTRGIARWDGNQWHSLGSGITSGTLHAMAVYNGSLYVGGNTTSIDSMTIRDIARWDGTNWYPVCTLSLGLSEVYALEVFNNELYVGGYFYTVNGVSIPNIAKFDGTSWSAVGGGLNGDVVDLYADTTNNRLYAVGSFSFANGGTLPCPSNVAFWDGNIWNAVGPNGPSLVPSEVYVHKNEVYIGNNIGYCFNSNGDTLSGIAKWDGNDWMPLGRGTYIQDTLCGAIYALLSYNNDLAIGGGFTTVGDTTANLIAAWGDTVTSLPSQEELSNEIKIFPNPFNNSTHISLSENHKGKLPLIFQLYQMDGKVVYETKVTSMEFEIQKRNISSGTFTYCIFNQNKQKLACGRLVME
ncbi:MAG: T9SS type A sorting domain-containing protein [Bacteroidetes bacterium]|nr:T9SS type A sorting domain-containing protein [Bacteroidota bacterium]